MAARYMPKTLAKTLTYISYHSPDEYGLFWSSDGTMPWKELYWAMQEDPSLRFVRESHWKELTYLGEELPASLEGNTLRLRPGYPPPDYAVAGDPPKRLFYGCRRKQLPFVRLHGLASSARPLLPLTSDRDLALRMAKRRDPDPVLIEVEAKEASLAGVVFLRGGADLYLVEFVDAQHLVCPPVREDAVTSSATKGKREKGAPRQAALAPGSFLVTPEHLRHSSEEKDAAAKGKKKRRGTEDDWKRQSRKERGKRTV